jgi:hypothetical protein
MTLMRFGPSAAACLMSVSLAACQQAGPPASATLPPLFTTVFDGTYRVAVSVAKVSQGGDATWCQTQPPASLNITGDQFRLALPHPNVPGNPTPTFVVAIAPDGSFQTQSVDGTASFAGQVSGTHLKGAVNMTGCEYAVSADRVL